MRLLILKDKKITADKMHELETAFTDFIFETTGILPTFYIKEQSYLDVPTVADSDGDTKPSHSYMSTLMTEVHNEYGDYGVDSVVMLVHRDNWIFKGIWGQNWSNLYYKYHLHLCRFDNRSLPNSLGTLYHEWMHCLDALIKTHTGFDVTKLFNLPYDKFIVHGGRPDQENTTEWKYIKWKDNVRALKLMTPHIIKAYQVRKDLYYAPLTNLQKYFISWLQSLLNKKNNIIK